MKRDYYIGVDLGGTKILSVLGTRDGEIVKELIAPTESGKGEKQIVDKIKAAIYDLASNVGIDKIKGIGIGAPGPLDKDKGIIKNPPNLPFNNYKIVEELEKEFKKKVVLDNDANAATIAEYKTLENNNVKNLVYITISTGVGAGAIIDGRLLSGNNGNALNLGHIVTSSNGRRCNCGKFGCLESVASGVAIESIAREEVGNGARSSLNNYEKITTSDVWKEALAGDCISNKIIDIACENIAISIDTIYELLDPDIIVFGGGVCNVGDIIINKIRSKMSNLTINRDVENIKIYRSKLNGKSGALGALFMAIEIGSEE